MVTWSSSCAKSFYQDGCYDMYLWLYLHVLESILLSVFARDGNDHPRSLVHRRELSFYDDCDNDPRSLVHRCELSHYNDFDDDASLVLPELSSRNAYYDHSTNHDDH